MVSTGRFLFTKKSSTNRRLALKEVYKSVLWEKKFESLKDVCSLTIVKTCNDATFVF